MILGHRPSPAVPFYQPSPLLTEAMAAATEAQMLGHGSHGPEVAAFERDLARFWGVAPEAVVCTDSCTSAMAISHVVLRSNSVAVPSITWPATANAAALAGCDVRFVPSSPRNGLGDFGDTFVLASCDTAVPVALYGQGVRLAPGKRNIVDAAHAFETGPVRGAQATCFSFHTLKSVGIGVGGCAVFDGEADADAARAIRFHGIQADRQQTRPGWKATMPAFAAAAGSILLSGVPQAFERRREVVRRYEAGLGSDWPFPASRTSARSPDGLPPQDSFHAFVVRVDDRAALQSILRECGIDTARYYPSLTTHPYWRGKPGVEPLDERLADGLLALPCHSRITDEDLDYVIATVNRHARPRAFRPTASALPQRGGRSATGPP